jgi:hypothetical protein
MLKKKIPKAFQNETIIDNFGFTIYRRCDNGRTVSKNGISLDNRNVFVYNMWLLKNTTHTLMLNGVTN